MQKKDKYYINNERVTKEDYMNVSGDWITLVSDEKLNKIHFDSVFGGKLNEYLVGALGLSTRHKAHSEGVVDKQKKLEERLALAEKHKKEILDTLYFNNPYFTPQEEYDENQKDDTITNVSRGEREVLDSLRAVKPLTIDEVFIDTPKYYDNKKGSLYKVASERGWNPYLFDVVKRLERGGKKDPLRQEIEKTKLVLDLWLKEQENNLDN